MYVPVYVHACIPVCVFECVCKQLIKYCGYEVLKCMFLCVCVCVFVHVCV